MKRVALLACLLLLSAIAEAAEPPTLLRELLAATNKARSAAGVKPLQEDRRLAAAAQAHASEMLELNYFSHYSPHAERQNLSDRLEQVGESAVNVAENLALFTLRAGLAEDVVSGWLESPSHREALLKSEYNRTGFGVAVDEHQRAYIVQVLAWKPWGDATAQLGKTGEITVAEIHYQQPTRGAVVLLDGKPAHVLPRKGRLLVPVSKQRRNQKSRQSIWVGLAGNDGQVIVVDAFQVDVQGERVGAGKDAH